MKNCHIVGDMARKAQNACNIRICSTLCWAMVAVIISILYQINLYNILFVIFGIGRKLQPIDDFPWSCTRLYHPLLEGCEDMWMDHNGRKLYAACTTVTSRQGWNPGGNKYNISARSGTDHIAVMNIDQPGPDKLYGLRELQFGGYKGDLDLHGFDVVRTEVTLRFWLINHKPPIDPLTGRFLDATVVGANSTIEIFDLDTTTVPETLQYVKTIISDAIISPNGIAVDDDGLGAVITNDHNGKVGAFRDLQMLYGSGSLTYCRSDSGNCHIAAKENFQYPNGIVKDRSKNGSYYVVHSVTGIVTVHELGQDGQLSKVQEIPLGYPVDNLSLDVDGNIIAAGIPDVFKFVQATQDPYAAVAPATILSISKIAGGHNRRIPYYNVSKLIEDKHGDFLPSATVALHDVMSKQLFVAGSFSPFITVCRKSDY